MTRDGPAHRFKASKVILNKLSIGCASSPKNEAHECAQEFSARDWHPVPDTLAHTASGFRAFLLQRAGFLHVLDEY